MPTNRSVRHRNIALPGDRGKHIETCAKYLGVSGSAFIDDAITDHINRTFGKMALESTGSTNA